MLAELPETRTSAEPAQGIRRVTRQHWRCLKATGLGGRLAQPSRITQEVPARSPEIRCATADCVSAGVREGERVLAALSTDSSKRGAVELAVADMRVAVNVLGEHPVSEATMASARHRLDIARYTVDVVAGRVPIGTAPV